MSYIFSEQDEYFMRRAIKEAELAYEEDEIPVGCVIVIDNQIIGRGHNQVEKLNDCTAHAEIIAITSACEWLQSKYINDATIYVTLEPCLMCGGAILWSRAKRLVFGCTDPKKGFISNGLHTAKQNEVSATMQIQHSLMQAECSQLLLDFFASKRKK